MDAKYTNRIIGWAVLAIVAYFVLRLILPFVMGGLIALVLWRIYQETRHR